MIRKIATLLIFSVVLCTNSMAELTLIDSSREIRDTPQGLANMGKDLAYWMRTTPTKENSSIDSRSISFQSFSSRGSSGQKKVMLPSMPLINFPAFKSQQAKDLIVVYIGQGGKIHISKINSSFTSVLKTIDLTALIFANEILSTTKGYVIGGIDADEFASLVFFDNNLAKKTKIVLPNKKRGAVTSMIFYQDRFFVITSHFDATSYMHELSLSGDVRNTTQLSGGGATGIALANRGFAVSYRVDREVFIERLDGNMKSLWTKKLHGVSSVATQMGNIHDMTSGIAWVGANNGKLIVYRIDDKGNTLHTAIDVSSGYGVPPSGSYMSIALGGNIHIRGEARKIDGPVDGSIDSIYFIESGDNR
jgi:hypothetical protein